MVRAHLRLVAEPAVAMPTGAFQTAPRDGRPLAQSSEEGQLLDSDRAPRDVIRMHSRGSPGCLSIKTTPSVLNFSIESKYWPCLEQQHSARDRSESVLSHRARTCALILFSLLLISTACQYSDSDVAIINLALRYSLTSPRNSSPTAGMESSVWRREQSR